MLLSWGGDRTTWSAFSRLSMVAADRAYGGPDWNEARERILPDMRYLNVANHFGCATRSPVRAGGATASER